MHSIKYIVIQNTLLLPPVHVPHVDAHFSLFNWKTKFRQVGTKPFTWFQNWSYLEASNTNSSKKRGFYLVRGEWTSTFNIHLEKKITVKKQDHQSYFPKGWTKGFFLPWIISCLFTLPLHYLAKTLDDFCHMKCNLHMESFISDQGQTETVKIEQKINRTEWSSANSERIAKVYCSCSVSSSFNLQLLFFFPSLPLLCLSCLYSSLLGFYSFNSLVTLHSTSDIQRFSSAAVSILGNNSQLSVAKIHALCWYI